MRYFFWILCERGLTLHSGKIKIMPYRRWSRLDEAREKREQLNWLEVCILHLLWEPNSNYNTKL